MTKQEYKTASRLERLSMRTKNRTRDFTPIERELVNQARILRADPWYGKSEDDVLIAKLRYEVLCITREREYGHVRRPR